MTAIKPENARFNEVQLSDGEEVILSYPSNHTQGKRAVGGKLFVTNHRIAFVPNRVDANMGGKATEMPLSKITLIGTDKPHFGLTEIFSGAWRTRLASHGRNEVGDFFVVGNPNAVAGEITSTTQALAEQ